MPSVPLTVVLPDVWMRLHLQSQMPPATDACPESRPLLCLLGIGPKERAFPGHVSLPFYFCCTKCCCPISPIHCVLLVGCELLLQETFGSGTAAQSEAGKKGGQIAKERGE